MPTPVSLTVFLVETVVSGLNRLNLIMKLAYFYVTLFDIDLIMSLTVICGYSNIEYSKAL